MHRRGEVFAGRGVRGAGRPRGDASANPCVHSAMRWRGQAEHLRVRTCSYWVRDIGGNLNLAGLLFSDEELALGFVPPCISPGRGKQSILVPEAGENLPVVERSRTPPSARIPPTQAADTACPRRCVPNVRN